MPSGYVYHGNDYKSPTPPESAKFTSMQRKYMGPEQAEQFRMAVYDLTSALTEKAGISPKPVYVLDPDQVTPFYTTIGNDLREAMRYLGYVLADSPEGAYVFSYSASHLNKRTPLGNPQIVSEGEPNVALALQIYDSVGKDARMLTEQRGNFFIHGAEYYDIPRATFSNVPYVRANHAQVEHEKEMVSDRMSEELAK
jgi:hypothetical protein